MIAAIIARKLNLKGSFIIRTGRRDMPCRACNAEGIMNTDLQKMTQ
jgi:hypothetical protein